MKKVTHSRGKSTNDKQPLNIQNMNIKKIKDTIIQRIKNDREQLKSKSKDKGFRPTEVPHVDTKENPILTTVDHVLTCPNELLSIQKKTEGSLSSIIPKMENIRLINSLKVSTTKDKENTDTFESININTLNNICKKENQKLKGILNSQTNNNFLKVNRLPCLEKHQKAVKTNKLGSFHKIMGEKYNPFNYTPNILRSQIGRNVNGSVYQH